MARIPTKVIDHLKSEVSVQRLAESIGIELKSHGQDLIGLCPFHDDHEPSLVITPSKNLWHCLGQCQRGGSVIDWVMKSEGVSFRHAVELLSHEYEPTLAAKPVKNATTVKLDTPFKQNIEDQQLLNQVIDYYHQTLLQSPDALSYLNKRGIDNGEAVEQFKIGYANRTLGYRLPKATRKAGNAIRSQLQNIGIYRASGHEHFSGSMIIPVLDEHRNVQEVYGRKLLDNLRKGTPKHLYLPGPHQGVFNPQAFTSSKEIILCESLIDALTFWCNGYRNVTASYGIEGFTKEHLEQFKQHDIERVLIAYDRDQAGEDAATTLSKQLMKEGLDCYRIHFPKNMDANEYALQVKPAPKSLGIAIRSAIWMGTGVKKSMTTKSIEEETNEVVLPASPIPQAPKEKIDAEVTEQDITINFEDRRYRVRGLHKNASYEVLKVNVMVSNDSGMHLDTFDLYQSRPRATFIKQASLELNVHEDVLKADLGKVLLQCERLQEQRIQQAQTPKPMTTELSSDEQQQAIKLLKSKQLLKRIQQDFEQCGIVGENTNTLVGYLATVSRKLDNPLAVIIQSTSAAGKSSLMDAVLKFIPNEHKVQYSAMTGQSLYYLGETNLKHKVLAIAEEEGAAQAAYALKLLQSEGQLTIASTTKDPDSGDLTTKEYKVEGPVMLFLTTTAIDIDEELLNRCVILTVNEDRAQTQAIHALQRKKRTLEGLIQKSEREALLQVHQNAQRLLKPLHVVNPFADQLTFIDTQTRTRRDHEKYLTLIDSIALLHQYQREIKSVMHNGASLQYIEVTLEDIAAANQLAHEVLGRTLDELPPQTRKLLTLINTMVDERCTQQNIKRNHYHFSRRDIRTYTCWTDFQVRTHIQRLVEMEYVLVHRGSRGQSFVYELLYDGKDQYHTPHLNGLIDIEYLKQHYDEKFEGQSVKNEGSLSPQRAPIEGSVRSSKNSNKACSDARLRETQSDLVENAYIKRNGKAASYTQVAVSK